jgi:hypothetical protein
MRSGTPRPFLRVFGQHHQIGYSFPTADSEDVTLRMRSGKLPYRRITGFTPLFGIS